MPKPKSFFEPWCARPSYPFWDTPLPPPPDTWDESEKHQWVADWGARKAKQEKDAPWYLWGSDMDNPTVALSLLGTPTVINDEGVITTITKHTAWPKDGPNHEEVAKRIAACVTACAGISDPVKFIADVRSLLRDQALNSVLSENNRIWELLGRCISNDEMKEIEGADDL